MKRKLSLILMLFAACTLGANAEEDETEVGLVPSVEEVCVESTETEVAVDAVVVDSVLTDEQADSIIALNKVAKADEVRDPLVAYPDDSINTPQHPYYNYKRDLTYAGIPLFLSSFIIKDYKKGFRSARNSFQKGFKSEIDNYTQYSPYAVVLGCKAFGYEGRSSWGRLAVSTAFSNIAMAAFVNSIKYSVKEMRPDNSTRNSFPSGHTATVFTAATILHKEYGLTRSPWFSIGGYAVATATGVMRVLNNRHWISDVMAGAGIGIMSTELGYFAADLIFKNRGVKRYEMDKMTDPNHPSFFDIQMGIGIHNNEIKWDDNVSTGLNDHIKLGTSTAFGVETAYFLNKHWGVGVMGRITSTPAKGLNLSDDDMANIATLNNQLASYNDAEGKPLPGIYNIYIENSNFNQASIDAGVYYHLPVGKYFSFGAKALVGFRSGDGITYKAKNGTPKVDGDMSLVSKDGVKYPIYWYEDADGSQFRSSELLDPGISQEYNFVLENETEEFEFMNVRGKSSFNYVLGVSFTWHYKSNFAWKVFADYDSAKSKYTYDANYFSQSAKEKIGNSKFAKDYPNTYAYINKTYHRESNHTFNLFTFGGTFSVYF